MTAPTIVHGMKSEDYHRHSALGSTSLKTLATRTPAHWKWEQAHPVQKDAYDLGTVVHALALEQDESIVVVVEAENWMTKAAKEAKAEARAEGKIPLLPKDWEQVKAMRDALMAHPKARVALEGGAAEGTVFWQHESGTPLKARPDKLHSGGRIGNLIVDLKTTANADPKEFGKTAASFGYHIQQAHYQSGIKAATGEEFEFVFVLVEKSPPYLASVAEIHPYDVERGAAMAERSIRIYNKCRESGVWPGYDDPEGFIELPKWSRMQEEAILNGARAEIN